jgi:hypothetical protein
MCSKKTVFNKLWLDSKLHPEFNPWLAEIYGSPFEAFCRTCQSKITLSNMGRQALVSHAGSNKHMKYATGHDKTQHRMTSFMRSSDDRSSSIVMSASNVTMKSDIHKDAGSVDSIIKIQSENVGNTTVMDLGQIEPEPSRVVASSSVNTGRSQCIVGYTSNDQVTRAEIVWCLKCITSHFSYNSSCDMKGIFQLMFPDSSIAQRMTIGSTKMAYSISYGLAPYFHSTLLTDIQKCPKIVVCFDEAMNRIAQRGKMDVVIRYWDDNAKLCLRVTSDQLLWDTPLQIV